MQYATCNTPRINKAGEDLDLVIVVVINERSGDYILY